MRDHSLNGGTGGLQVLTRVEIGGMLGKILPDGGGHCEAKVRVDVDLADGAAGSLTELVLEARRWRRAYCRRTY